MKPIQPKTKMNKTEVKYAQGLALLKSAKEIIDWRFEPFNLRLADNTFYRPDFFIIHKEHFEVVEIKGFLRDDALVKFKVAAKEFPWWHWRMLRLVRGEWEQLYSF